MEKLSVSFIGAGNVGSALAKILVSHVSIDYIYTKSGKSALLLANEVNASSTTEISDVLSSDMVIIAVTDKAIKKVAQKLSHSKSTNPLLVHTAGAVASEVLSVASNRYGVFYPLQTFTKGFYVDFRNVPFCLSANTAKDLKTIVNLAGLLSDKVEVMGDKDRAKLHLAAVIANNFTNTLLYQCEQLLAKESIDYRLLLPLLEETIRKAQLMNPYKAQTGPARRGDEEVIKRHLSELSQDPMLYKLYYTFTEIITKTYENNRRD